MKTITTLVTIVLLASIAATAFAADAKTGCVDVDRILNKVEAGVQVKAKLAELAKQAQEEINKMQESLKKLDKADKQYQTKEAELQAFYSTKESDIHLVDADLTKKLYNNLLLVVGEYARKNSYVYISQKNDNVLFCANDVTDEVIGLYNATYKK